MCAWLMNIDTAKHYNAVFVRHNIAICYGYMFMSSRTMIEKYFLKGKDYYVSIFLVAVAHFSS